MNNNNFQNRKMQAKVIGDYIIVPSNAKPLVKTSITWGTASATEKTKLIKTTHSAPQNKN